MTLKTTILRVAQSLVLILIILGIAAYVMVHTAAFNRYVLATITQKAEESTGGRVRIGRIAIHWANLGVDFYDVSLYGQKSESRTPLLAADHLGIGLKIVSLFRRKIDLDEIVLDRPVVHFAVDAQGNTNLPHSPSSSTSGSKSVFELGIKNVAIHSGEIYYNDERIPLSAELHDFETQIASSFFSGDYTGKIAYDRGRLLNPSFNPVEHSAQLQFTANLSGLTLTAINVSTGKSHLEAHGKLSNYADPEVQASFDAVLDTNEIARLAKTSSIPPSGEIAVKGTLRYRAAPNRTFIDLVDVSGSLHSATLSVPFTGLGTEVKSIDGTYALRNGNLDVRNLNADLLGGKLSANFEMLHLGGTPDSRIEATLRGVSLSDIGDLAYGATQPRIRVVGRTDIDVHAGWIGNMRNLTAQSHVVIRSPAQSNLSGSAIPLNGVIDANYDGAKNTLSFKQSHLQTGNTDLSVSGTMSKLSNLNVVASTRDLSEIAALVMLVRNSTAKSNAPLNLPELRGSATFTAQVSGAVSNPDIKGQLTASNVEVAGTGWPALKSQVELKSSVLSVQNGYVENGRQGRIAFDLRAGLQQWVFTDVSPVSLEATVTWLSVADIQRAAHLQYPITGLISGKISLTGTERNPAGRGSLQISDGVAWNETVHELALNFDGDGNSIHSTAQLEIPAGAVAANVTYSPSQRSYQATLNTSGLKLENLQALQARNLEVSGTLSGAASGSGTMEAPKLTGNFQIPLLQVRGQTISQVQASLDVTRQHANVSFNSTVAAGYVQAKADVSLTGEYPATASVDVRALPLQLLVAAYVPMDVKFEGETEFHASMSGPLKDPAKIVAHLQIPELNVAYNSMKIANASPLNLDYSDGIISLKRAEMKGSGADLIVQGEAPVVGSAGHGPAALNISANGTMDMGILQGLSPETRSSGKVDVQLTARGDLWKPDVQGSIRVENAAFSSLSLPVGVETMNGQIALSGNRIDIRQLSGKAGGGDLSIQGSLILGDAPVYNLALHANSVRVRPDQMRAVLNADLQLSGTSQDSVISGRVLVDRLSFVRGFDLSDFAAQFSGPESVTAPSPFERNMRLNIAVQSSQNLSLASNQLSLEGAANLNVVGNVANPVILGRVSLTGGEVFFLGKRYQLQSGSIVFSNPVRTEPNLNLFVITTVEQYNITLNLVGTLDRLRTNYTSDPTLSTIDIINLIAFGQTTAERQSTSANTTTTMGAESVVAQGVGSQLAGGIAKSVGISQLTIDPLAGSSQNPGAQVAIQQRVTGNLLLTFSTDVTSTQSETVQLQYQLDPRWQVTVLRDQNGGYGMMIRLHTEF